MKRLFMDSGAAPVSYHIRVVTPSLLAVGTFASVGTGASGAESMGNAGKRMSEVVEGSGCSEDNFSAFSTPGEKSLCVSVQPPAPFSTERARISIERCCGSPRQDVMSCPPGPHEQGLPNRSALAANRELLSPW